MILWEFVPILAILVGYLIVCRVGAVLLTMTGLDQPTAQFQALSALTGTGFTTRASEMIVGHEVRRRIVMVLMLIGNLGMAGGIVALITIFRSYGAQLDVIRAVSLAAVIFLIFWISGRKKMWRRLNNGLKIFLEQRPMFRESTAAELLSFHDDFSIVEIHVQASDFNVNKALRDTDFRGRKILVLAIERNHKMIAMPEPEELIHAGDKLICYGNIESIADSIIQF
ncbi:MAG: TrkA C-terminal domain-containing protein [Gemmatimonadota bacterium]|nr:TrkA C-terminal domain-containing protein [Gemmatimonadota bacterium]